MIQIILGLVIVAIGLFTFIKYPIKSDVRQVTLGALFIVLTVVLKRLAIMVPFLGFPSLKITLEVLPLIVAGLVLQPGYCFIVAVASDGLGLILANAGGFPFFGFTLNAILQTMIPCLLKMYLPEKMDKVLEKLVSLVMAVISVAAIIYIFNLNDVSISGEVYVLSTALKVVLSAVIVLMVAILIGFIQFYKHKLKQNSIHIFYLSVLSVVCIEMVVTFFLTPYWLQIMYGIPFFASQFVRILKACFMIPIGIFVVYTMYRSLYRFIK